MLEGAHPALPGDGLLQEQDGGLMDPGASKTVPITIPQGGSLGQQLLEVFVRAGFVAAPPNPMTAPQGR